MRISFFLGEAGVCAVLCVEQQARLMECAVLLVTFVYYLFGESVRAYERERARGGAKAR